MSALMDKVLGRLEKVRKTGQGYQARCPAHADRGPSLAIKQVNDRVLIHCFAGCEPAQVLEAMDLKWSDLFEGSLSEKDQLFYKLKGLQEKLHYLDTLLHFYQIDARHGELSPEDWAKYRDEIQNRLDLLKELHKIKSRLKQL